MLYEHWGTYMGPAGAAQEPNNPAAQCAVANHTQEYDNAWGWADTSCSDRFPIMCRCAMGCQEATCSAVHILSSC
jgi:hypothetical protein